MRNLPGAALSAPARPRVAPAVVPTPVPAANHPVPMEVDRARARTVGNTTRVCYRCGEAGHLANSCPNRRDVRVVDQDLVGEVIQQMDADEQEDLLARLLDARAVAQHEREVAQEGFLRCVL
uniref:Gag protein n=1 Tax=Mycena chlorophos TaxID=658473 RepID=A0ABQ0M750_MYCCL|nr:gag protein [Mycena chlorophos]